MNSTFCPMGRCICNTVQSQSMKIWDDLNDADHYGVAYDEDTITQAFALDMVREHPLKNRIHVLSNTVEGKYGADFVWTFLDETFRKFHLLVQAKRLKSNGKYKAFDKKKNQAGKMLGVTGANLPPIYLLYNYRPALPEYEQIVENLSPHFFYPFYFPYPAHLGRDLGLLFTFASNLRNAKSLSLNGISAECLPLWTLFCDCLFHINGKDPLAHAYNLLQSVLPTSDERDTSDAKKEEKDVPGFGEAPDWLKNWFLGHGAFEIDEFYKELKVPDEYIQGDEPSLSFALFTMLGRGVGLKNSMPDELELPPKE